MRIKEKKERVGELDTQIAEFATRYGDDPSQMTTEEKVQFDGWVGERENALADIERCEAVEKAKAIEASRKALASFTNTVGGTSYGVDSEAERVMAFRGWMASRLTPDTMTPRMRQAMDRTGWKAELNQVLSFDQSIGDASEGGNLLSGSLFKTVIDRLKEPNNVLGECNVIETADDLPFHFGTNDNTSAGLTLVDELGDIGDTAKTFGKVSLGSYQYSTDALGPISRQQIRSTSFDIVGYYGRMLSSQMNRGMNSLLVTADGSSKPQGLKAGLTVGKTVASPTAITFQELEDLINSVDSSYHGNAKLYMTRPTYSYFTMKVDGEDRPLVRSYADRGPPNLLGFPVVFFPSMDNIAASKKPVFFGDLREAFCCRIAGGLSVESSNELYWRKQALALAGWISFDSKVVNTYAAASLATPAS